MTVVDSIAKDGAFDDAIINIADDYTRPNDSVGEDSWNEVSVEEACNQNQGPLQGVHTVPPMSSISEKASQKFIKDEKMLFVSNTILQEICLKPVLDSANQWSSSTSMLKGAGSPPRPWFYLTSSSICFLAKVVPNDERVSLIQTIRANCDHNRF